LDSGVPEFLREKYSFPSADLVAAAAALFPAPVTERFVRRSAGRGALDTSVTPRSYLDQREGVVVSLDVAPGLVRVRRHDDARAERTRERMREDHAKAVTRHGELAARVLHAPMVFVDEIDLELFDEPLSKGKRGNVKSWSNKSRARLVSSILELDLAPLVGGAQIPGMVTLTLPGDWLAVAPDAATAAAKFDNFRKAWEDRWGKLRCIWKREFQRRGAPHWHLWLVPPVPMSDMWEFNAWLSETWTGALFGVDALAIAIDHSPTPVDRWDKRVKCDCSDVCKSLAAGTGVDFAEAMRARDPKRLAVYFLKESLGGEGKAYQNEAPAEWSDSVGRFWGVRGIEKVIATVEVEPAVAVQLVRTVRRWQRAQRVTREVNVWGTRERDARKRAALRESGEVVVRKVRRRQNTIGSAGWVAVNDGSALASQLSRLVEQLTARVAWDRDMFAGSHLVRDKVAWAVSRPAWAAEGPLLPGQYVVLASSRLDPRSGGQESLTSGVASTRVDL
jgi:hypothetical protein